jgi:tripartite-type tricarboxylate transporter receptor subunit TctC
MGKSKIGAARALLFLLCLVWSLGSTSSLYAQSNFYQGKSIRVVRGGQVGDLYDLWARLIAGHLGKHIPGNPSIVVQNMPGAGSVIAANYVYGLAKPDGLTIGSITPAIYMDQHVARKEVQFDWAKFVWLGTPEQTDFLLFIRSDNSNKNFDDLRKAAEPPKCGSTGTGSPQYHIPRLLEDTLAVKFNLITGYQGASDIDLALERGEIHCRTITIAAYSGREPFLTWGKNGFLRPLVQTGRKRDPSLTNVPTFYELMDRYKTSEAGRRLATVVLAPSEFGRPMVTTPGVPAERIKLLREAWNKTLKDPELLAEAKKRDWLVGPVAGEELEALAKDVVAQPPEVIQRLKKLLGE